MSDDNKVLTSDEVKENVIQELSLDYDNEEHKVIVDKIVEEKVETQKNLSKAIEQKANYRKVAVDGGLLDPETFEPIEKKGVKTEAKKPNETQSGLSREEGVLISQGHTLEEVDLAIEISKLKGISLLEATEDNYFKSKVDERVKEEVDSKASLGASKGAKGAKPPKSDSEMTDAERKERYDEEMKNIS